MYYDGEQFRGHPTRVFAYYASPATLDPKTAKGERFPAVVLLHGGGGTAFRDWAKLWAKRGYAAIVDFGIINTAAMANARRRSASPSASTSPPAATASDSANAS